MTQLAAVRISTFSTSPGLVESTDETFVCLLTPEQVAKAMGDPEELYNIAMTKGRMVRPEELIDLVKRRVKHSAGEYEIHEGILSIPEDLVAVQVTRTSWCTSDYRTYEAHVIKGKEALKEMYLRRSREYTALANKIDE